MSPRQVRALTGQNIVTSNTSLPAIGESKKTLNREVEEVEIVEDYFSDSNDNRTRRRLELERLKQDLDDGVLTQEEYEYERQKILNKYPLRK